MTPSDLVASYLKHEYFASIAHLLSFDTDPHNLLRSSPLASSMLLLNSVESV